MLDEEESKKEDCATLEMKCRKCRNILLHFPQTRVESSHGALATDTSAKHCPSEIWYIPEESMPSWMHSNVDKGGWQKGKVQCPKCDARLGSYNFVSGMKCQCGLQVAAPIHIVKSKVDFFIPPRISANHPEKVNDVLEASQDVNEPIQATTDPPS